LLKFFGITLFYVGNRCQNIQKAKCMAEGHREHLVEKEMTFDPIVVFCMLLYT